LSFIIFEKNLVKKNSVIKLDKQEIEIFENLTKIIEKYKIEKHELKDIVKKTCVEDFKLPLHQIQTLNILEWDTTHWSQQISIYDST
jgi:replication initiation and membrane attachment protein DnaB